MLPVAFHKLLMLPNQLVEEMKQLIKLPMELKALQTWLVKILELLLELLIKLKDYGVKPNPLSDGKINKIKK